MTFEVTHLNNFVRIFQIPSNMPTSLCFGGGHPVFFEMVDWFNPVNLQEVNRGSRLSLTGARLEALRESLREFIRGTRYYDPEFKYLAITDYGDAFLIEKENDVSTTTQRIAHNR